MSDELKKAMERGAQIDPVAKLVEVSGLATIVDDLTKLAERNHREHSEQVDKLIEAIDSLVAAVNEKQVDGPDLSPLIEAVMSLRHEATVAHPEPCEWEIGFERDQRGFMKSGVRLTPLPRVIN